MNPPLLLLDMAALEQMLSLGHTTIEKLVKAGDFPPPVYIGRSRRWLMSAVEDWVERKVRPAPDQGNHSGV